MENGKTYNRRGLLGKIMKTTGVIFAIALGGTAAGAAGNAIYKKIMGPNKLQPISPPEPTSKELVDNELHNMIRNAGSIGAKEIRFIKDRGVVLVIAASQALEMVIGQFQTAPGFSYFIDRIKNLARIDSGYYQRKTLILGLCEGAMLNEVEFDVQYAYTPLNETIYLKQGSVIKSRLVEIRPSRECCEHGITPCIGPAVCCGGHCASGAYSLKPPVY